MSADNWRECPNCDSQLADQQLEAERELEAAYGKVPSAEYERRRAALNDLKRKLPEETLREDYEFYLDITAMELNISYRCCCDCGFSFSHDETIPVPSDSSR